MILSLFAQTLNIGAGLNSVSLVAKGLMGVGIGLGISFALDFKGLKLISGPIAGAIATSGLIVSSADPLTTFFVVIITMILVSLVFKKKTPVDILIIPLFTLIVAYLLTIILFPPISFVIAQIGQFLITATCISTIYHGLCHCLSYGSIINRAN